MTRRRLAVSIAVFAVFAGACGTTAPAKRKTGAAAGSAAPAAAPGESGGPGASVAPGDPGAKRGTKGKASTGARGGTSGSTTGAGAPPVTATEVKIGFYITQPGTSESAYAALGVDVSRGDETLAVNAIVAHVNGTGGLAGRKIVPVIFYYDQNANFTTQYERGCTHFTQDNLVFAVVSGSTNPGVEGFADCLHRRGVPLMLDTRWLHVSATFRPWGNYVLAPSYLLGDRWDAIVDVLADGGYFDGPKRVGLLWQDEGAAASVAKNVIKPKVIAAGATVVAEESYATYRDAQGLGASSSQIASLVLRFRTANASHIIFVGTAGTAPLFFIPAADAQEYRPRYGFNSTELPQIMAGTVPARAMARAFGAGWQPTQDIDFAQDTKPIPAQAECLDVVKKAGGTFSSRFAAHQAAKICEGVFFLRDTLGKAGTVSVAAIRSGANTLGAFRSPMTFSANVAGRPDGVAALRPFAFDDGCGCFKYAGDLRPIG